MRLFDYFQPFENRDGLLEKLEGWVFVEWSAANRFVQDVNYPSNMLYAGTLSAAGRLDDKPDLVAKAEVNSCKKTVRVRFADLPLQWCEGWLPTPDGPVALRWWKDGDKLAYRLTVPEGYKVDVENRSGRQLVEH